MMTLLALPTFTASPAPANCFAGEFRSFPGAVGGKWKGASNSITNVRRGFEPVRAFFPNPTQEPILKEALKEPVAFVGGIFAGLLRLDLNEDPLKDWVSRTVEASGISAEEISKVVGGEEEEMPQQIEIE